MSRRVSLYIITLLITGTVVLPAFFNGPTPSPLFLDENAAKTLIFTGLPLLVLLVIISLSGSPETRCLRGWVRPRVADIPLIVTLLAVTLILGRVLPADSNSYSVRLPGLSGMVLILIVSLISALTEELFFRSWLLSVLPSIGWPGWAALTLSVLIFASVHLWQGWAGLVFSAVSGTVYALVFQKRPALFPIVTAHTLHNAMALWLASGR